MVGGSLQLPLQQLAGMLMGGILLCTGFQTLDAHMRFSKLERTRCCVTLLSRQHGLCHSRTERDKHTGSSIICRCSMAFQAHKRF
eukprot:364904-Chlamydomonas_euryale.AAC.11